MPPKKDNGKSMTDEYIAFSVVSSSLNGYIEATKRYDRSSQTRKRTTDAIYELTVRYPAEESTITASLNQFPLFQGGFRSWS